LYERAIERTGPTATLLEWDDNIPAFAEVHAEALKANRYLAKHLGKAGHLERVEVTAGFHEVRV
jgi:hypothetical protein